jgi:hypothetical protein
MDTVWAACLRRNHEEVSYSRVPAIEDIEYLVCLAHDGPRGSDADESRKSDLVALLRTAAIAVEFVAAQRDSVRFPLSRLGGLVDTLLAYVAILHDVAGPLGARAAPNSMVRERLELATDGFDETGRSG